MDVTDLTEQEAFKAGFLAFCKEAGWSDSDIAAHVKVAAGGSMFSRLLKGLSDAGLHARVGAHRIGKSTSRWLDSFAKKPNAAAPAPNLGDYSGRRGGGGGGRLAAGVGAGALAGGAAGAGGGLLSGTGQAAAAAAEAVARNATHPNTLMMLAGVPLAGGLALGGLAGWGTAKMTAPNVRDEDIRAQEIEHVYKTQAKRLKARRDYEKYREARGL
jgi:hypothetical protein